MRSIATSRRGSAFKSTTATGTRQPSSDEQVLSTSGLVPAGDVRLTANIRADLHLALKIRAAQERTTMGELIEQWIETWKEDD